MEEAAFGVGINSMPQGWTDRAQLPEEAQHCHCSQGCCLLPQPWSCAQLTQAAEREGVRAKPAGPTRELRLSLGPKALPSSHHNSLLIPACA